MKTLTTTTDRAAYGVKMEAQGDSKALGIRLKQASKDVCKSIAGMSNADICRLQEQGIRSTLMHCIGMIRLFYYGVSLDNNCEENATTITVLQKYSLTSDGIGILISGAVFVYI